MIILITILAYFCLIFFVSKVVSRGASNETFFRANKRSPWAIVAFGMIGASISGVTFVSVPGMIVNSGMMYLQTCLGFILGYFLVAFILLPIYYRLDLTTIYTYLNNRLGKRSYKTGAAFFILSDLTASAIKFYVVCMLLQKYLLDEFGIPFFVTVLLLILFIWLYTRRGGVKALVWTDFFQTFCMLIALVLIFFKVISELQISSFDAIKEIVVSPYSKVFEFGDIISPQNFFKQFISGAFIVIVMTGLNQNMMQKNLTCKTLKAAKKDMCSYGLAFLPVNLLLLSLGILLVLLAQKNGLPLPSNSDELLPMFVFGGHLGLTALIFFVIAIAAASFSTADSSLTALTTTLCVDIFGRAKDEALRQRVHILLALGFALFIILFGTINSRSLLDAIYILCSYTYGPLLGLFSFCLLTKRRVNDKLVPLIAILSPVLCFLIDYLAKSYLAYKFSYEMLLLNGALTFFGMFIISENSILKGENICGH